MKAILVFVACLFSLCLAQPDGYASLSGVGNNRRDPGLQSVFTGYLRITNRTSYVDGLGVIDTSLPNERELSNRLFAIDVVRPQLALNDLHIGFGQAISHDIQSVSSTDPDLGIEVEGEDYFVQIPTGDPYFDPYGTGDKVMTFKRRNYMLDTGTGTGNIRDVKNLVSPLLDLSIVYSNFDDILELLRNDTHRRYMKIGYNVLGEPTTPFNTMGVPMENQFKVPDEKLYAAGHAAANQNPMILACQVLFLLEHNRLADELHEEHPSWSEEKLFWEARRWNIAQFQAIAYNEYFPSQIGFPLPIYEGYDDTVSVAPTFTFNAAFRVAHSNLSPQVLFVSENKEILTSIRFRDSYFRPELIDTLGLSNLIRGLIFQQQDSSDISYVSDVRNFLFGAPGQGGIDLAALCTFRARDMGIANYNDLREAYNLSRVEYYSEVIENVDLAAALHDFYGHPDNAEGFVMGLAEDPPAGAAAGPLFAEAILEHAVRLRAGDRFYYENDDAGFDDEEIEIIARTTIADIVLRNTNIQQVPCSAFFTSPDYDCGEPPVADTEFVFLENQVELLNGDIILSWSIVDDVINFAAEGNTDGWFGIGLASNPGNMVGADAMIGWVEGGTPVVGDYRITARAVGCDGVCPDSQQGGSNDITDVDGSESGGKTLLQWSRALDTGDGEDEVITDGINAIVFAMGGSDTLGYHNSRKGAADINFFTGDLTLTAVDELDGPNDRLTVHGVLMWFAWSVVFPLGIVAVKFCRKLLPRWWFRIHMFMQYFGVLIIIVALILAVEAVADLAHDHIGNPHAIMGVIAVSLAIITPALGQATAVMYEAPKKVPIFPDRAHSLLGYLSPLVAFVTIYLGLDEKDVDWYWYFLVSIWLFFITVTYWSAFIAQYFYQIYTSKKNRKANMAISAEEDEDSWSSGED